MVVGLEREMVVGGRSRGCLWKVKVEMEMEIGGRDWEGGAVVYGEREIW